jgi:hypothetical protein
MSGNRLRNCSALYQSRLCHLHAWHLAISLALALARPSLWSHPRSPTSRPTRLMCAHRTRESPPQSRAVPHSGRRVSRA